MANVTYENPFFLMGLLWIIVAYPDEVSTRFLVL